MHIDILFLKHCSTLELVRCIKESIQLFRRKSHFARCGSPSIFSPQKLGGKGCKSRTSIIVLHPSLPRCKSISTWAGDRQSQQPTFREDFDQATKSFIEDYELATQKFQRGF